MPKIILRTAEGKNFITEAANWPDPWSVDTPPLVKANVYGRIESVFFMQTRQWVDNKRLYIEVLLVGEAIQYTTEEESRYEANQQSEKK